MQPLQEYSFKKGDKLNATRDVNPLFRAVKELQNMKGANGIIIRFSSCGPVISYNGDTSAASGCIISLNWADPSMCNDLRLTGDVTVTDNGDGTVTVTPTSGTFVYVFDLDGVVSIGYSGTITKTVGGDGIVTLDFAG